MSQQALQAAPYTYLHLECNGTSVLVVAPSFGQIDSRIFLWDATFTSSPAWLEYVRGQDDFQHGDWQAAEKHVREAIKWTDSCYEQVAHHDSFALAHELLGQVYLREHLNKKAKAEFQTTLRMDPHSGGAWIGLGTVLNDLGRYDDAIKALTQGVQETPENLWGAYELARAHHAKNPKLPFNHIDRDTFRIGPELHPVAQEKSFDTPAFKLLASKVRADMTTGPLQPTEDDFGVRPRSAWSDYFKGQQALEQGDLETAVMHLKAAIKKTYKISVTVYGPPWEDPITEYNPPTISYKSTHFPLAHEVLGQAYLFQGKYKEAQEAFQTALYLTPDSVAALIGMGTTLNQFHNYTDAEQDLKKGLEVAPSYFPGRYELARAYVGEGQWQAAKREIEKILTENPDYGPAHKPDG